MMASHLVSTPVVTVPISASPPVDCTKSIIIFCKIEEKLGSVDPLHTVIISSSSSQAFLVHRFCLPLFLPRCVSPRDGAEKIPLLLRFTMEQHVRQVWHIRNSCSYRKSHAWSNVALRERLAVAPGLVEESDISLFTVYLLQSFLTYRVNLVKIRFSRKWCFFYRGKSFFSKKSV